MSCRSTAQRILIGPELLFSSFLIGSIYVFRIRIVFIHVELGSLFCMAIGILILHIGRTNPIDMVNTNEIKKKYKYIVLT